jgi:GTPase SAR1 family protein
MDITMIGLQNAGKTSLLRVLAVSSTLNVSISCVSADTNFTRAASSLLSTADHVNAACNLIC